MIRHSCLIRLLAITLVSAPCLAAEPPVKYEIHPPPGMKTVTTTTADHVLHITFVAADAPDGDAAPAAAAKPADAAAMPPPLSGGSPSAFGKLEDFDFDRPIGEVPAFTALGLSPETVAHPSSPRDFGAALLNGVDANGVLQTGIALETAPFRLFDSIASDHDTYANSYWHRFMYHSSLSIATSKASEDDKAVQLAIGFSAILYQDRDSDPLRSPFLDAAFVDANDQFPMTGHGRGASMDTAAASGANAYLLTKLQEFRERAWAGTLWTAAVAPTWNSKDGSYSGLESAGFSAWTTFAYGLEKPIFGRTRVQFSGQIRYRQGELVTDEDDDTKTAEQDSLIAAGRFRLGTVDFNGFIEGGYVRIWDGLEGDGDGWRVAAGLEKHIGPDTWLVISAGQQFGSKDGEDDETFAIGSIRFGLADTPHYPLDTGAAKP